MIPHELPDGYSGPVVYFIQIFDRGPIKIGFVSKRELALGRLAALQTASPWKLTLRNMIVGGRQAERELHDRFARWRLEGEWFANVAELAQLAQAPGPGARDPLRRFLPMVDRAFEAGRQRGKAETELEAHRLFRYELEQLAKTVGMREMDEPGISARLLAAEGQRQRLQARALAQTGGGSGASAGDSSQDREQRREQPEREAA